MNVKFNSLRVLSLIILFMLPRNSKLYVVEPSFIRVGFLEYDDSKKYLLKIYDIMKEQFPSWKNNMYYKKSSWKLKLICNLSYKRQYILLKIIKKIFER